MSAALDDNHKPLPRVDKFDKLPPPPPIIDPRDSVYSAPPPPPKIVHESNMQLSGPPSLLPPIPTLPSFGNLDATLNVPLTPTTPTSPTSFSALPSPSADGKSKKSNPLIDLVETERLYVDQLTGIIRKVAAAWSRSNLPPPELDTMFRSVESVYKANRSLLSRLKDIGTNPSSPKALGDLLMRWIDDLEGPYTAYCDKYCAGFDIWEPIVSNARLPKVLANFSAATPPPPSAVPPPDSGEPPVWTLDALFLLPKGRLKYYRKLYNRLLKSTTPGRSDHRLLIGALDKLDKLMTTLEVREDIHVASLAASVAPPAVPAEHEDEVVIDLRTPSVIVKAEETSQPVISPTPFRGSQAETATESTRSSTQASSRSSRERLSRETASTSISRASTATFSRPISDLERRLATDRTLDIFTMKPKAVRLQMAPPTLTFLREMRYSADVTIRLTPRATGEEVIHRQGHVFILSDLFLVCERMTSEEKDKAGGDGPDMWLLYPPLAGKVLRVSEDQDDNSMQVLIMRKETLLLQTESPQVRATLLSEFKECIAFASSLPPPAKEPPPPLPPLPGMQRSPSAPIPSPNRESASSTPPMPSRVSGSSDYTSPPVSQRSSSSAPSTRQSNEQLFPPRRFESRSQNSSPQRLYSASASPNLVLSPEAQVQQGVGRVPSLQNPLPDPMYPSRTSSTAQTFPGHGQGPSFAPGQMIPPNGPRPTMGTTLEDPGFHSNPGGHNTGYGPHNHIGRGPPSTYQPPPPNHLGPQQFPPKQNWNGPPQGGPGPPRPPYHGAPHQGGMRHSPSTPSLNSQYEQGSQGRPPAPPMPPGGGYPGPRQHANSFGAVHAPQPRTLLPSMQMNAPSISAANTSFNEPSPPNSPVEETRVPTGPVTSTIAAQMKCKVFLKREHAQWKSLGSAKLKLYRQDPTNVKQLVVEADDRQKSVLISTIVLTDGVERVGKTGVAVELSDRGARTGIVYMIQLRNEQSAGGLFDSLLAGSDRAALARN